MRYYDRMEKKVTDAMLFRFFAEQTTLEETDMISAWLNEDPEKNQKVLDKAYNLYVLGIMCAPNPEAGIKIHHSALLHQDFLIHGFPRISIPTIFQTAFFYDTEKIGLYARKLYSFPVLPNCHETVMDNIFCRICIMYKAICHSI